METIGRTTVEEVQMHQLPEEVRKNWNAETSLTLRVWPRETLRMSDLLQDIFQKGRFETAHGRSYMIFVLCLFYENRAIIYMSKN